jgi:hypothetical protein
MIAHQANAMDARSAATGRKPYGQEIRLAGTPKPKAGSKVARKQGLGGDLADASGARPSARGLARQSGEAAARFERCAGSSGLRPRPAGRRPGQRINRDHTGRDHG